MNKQTQVESAELDILTREDLEAAASLIAGGRIVEDLSSYEVDKLITVGQYLTDRCLAEIERRGELEFEDGTPVLPYCSEHGIETILTRDFHPGGGEGKQP
ncbi:MAG TPA: hypothetical protein VGN93_31190 [Shinella sp.]|jgi:hypothetical protein|uniref:hypothetical protein n=1 Tax=Shinella sp. TaxID=1870904 RepID=UPI002E0DAA4B|nr:hypothetical protein [Shinella sp.]